MAKYNINYLSPAEAQSRRLSEHFTLWEFICKTVEHHGSIPRDAQYESKLFEKLESLFALIGATRAVISSGYRSEEHDKCVGGSGGGPHVSGDAVDICFYKNNIALDARKVACICEEYRLFNGIANINSSHAYIHLDMKNRRWVCDEETIGYSGSIYIKGASDFYDYYSRIRGLQGFTKSEVHAYFNIGSNTNSTTNTNIVQTNEYKITLTTSNTTNNDPIILPTYFPNYTGSSIALKAALVELSESSSDWYITQIARRNDIPYYTASLSQEQELMRKLKQGTLLRP